MENDGGCAVLRPKDGAVALAGCRGCMGVKEAIVLLLLVELPEGAGLSVAKELSVWSGVMAREFGWVEKAPVLDRAEGVGVDHEKAATVLDWARCGWGRRVSPSMSLPLGVLLPSTRRSKSFSLASPPALDPTPLVAPMLMRSLNLGLSAVVCEVEAKSRSLRVCSCSIFDERDLISVMKSWNWCRLSSGPRLKDQSMGRTSIARKSESAILPTCLKTARAAIMTAGSFVFITFRSGTTFSCTVYLSRIALLFGFRILELLIAPLRSSPESLPSDVEPPQRMTKASNPRILIPRLLVLLNTAATTGNSSLLIVVKSRVARIVGRHPSDLSMIECVGDSRPSCRIGRISTSSQYFATVGDINTCHF